jgi:hypothetical protein
MWEEYGPATDPRIYGARVSRAGAVLDRLSIPRPMVANDQSSPAVAFDGVNYLVVWADRRSGTSDIYAARVSGAGVILDGAGTAVSTAAFDQSAPAVAFDGTNFLLVWADHHSETGADISGARMSREGVVLDAVPIAVSTAENEQSRPVLAFDGTDYLVVWEDLRNDLDFENEHADIYGTRVSRAGSVRDGSGIPISLPADPGELVLRQAPGVAFDGTNHLVVWAEDNGLSSHIRGARVSRSGAVLDGASIPISAGTEEQFEPAVAFDGATYLVVWQQRRYGSDIYGARVSRAGVVKEGSGIVVTAAAGDQDSPSVAFNGHFLVVWRDRRSGTSSDVYANRVDTGGCVLDGDGFAVARSGSDEQAPVVTKDPAANGRFGIVYQRFAAEAPYGSNRVFLRTSPK